MKKLLFDVVFMSVYFIPFKLLLQKAGVKKSAIFFGKAPLNGYAYFTGEIETKKVFIKFDTKYHFINNDVIAYKYCKNKIQEYLIKIISYKNTGKIHYIIYEYFEGKTLSQSDLLQDTELILKIYKIISSINKLGLIHRDIKLDNFLINGDKLKIIDLTLMASLNGDIKFNSFNDKYENEAELLRSLNKKYSPKGMIWNDYYSFQKILKEILSNKHNKINEAKKKILADWIAKIEKNIKNSNYQLP